MSITFDLKDVLQAVGPTASLIFAAWIFLSYLEQRYSAAYERYRALVAEFREHAKQDQRSQSLVKQIMELKVRCQQMRLATHLGLIAAILLIISIICGALNAIDEHITAFRLLSAGTAILGLTLIIWAAVLVMIENWRLQRAIEIELSDLPALANAARESRS